MAQDSESGKKLVEVLKKQNLLTRENIKELKRISKSSEDDMVDILIDNGFVTDKIMLEVLSKTTRLPIVDLGKNTIEKKTLDLIPARIARENSIVPFQEDESTICVAMYNPRNEELLSFLEKKTKRGIKPYLARKSVVKDALLSYETELTKKLEGTKETIMKRGDKHKAEAVTELLDEIILRASMEHVSDIHIEPQEKEIIIRFRRDGVLKDILFIPKSYEEVLITRIKVLSNLRTDEHRKSQDGRIKIDNEDLKLSLRVSIIPIYNGEKVVLRLLAGRASLNLEDLGYTKEQLKTLNNTIKKTHGMILVTGPTGCGKTTTLYSALQILNTRDINISTIEDPVEIRLPGANQIQVNNAAELTFANGLRSILRQDPDVILVGEIRDAETAGIAVNAALTGHLVFATLHTNDAASTLPRMMEMGVEHFLVASTVNMIIAQRLARKTCPYCKTEKKQKLGELLSLFSNLENFDTDIVIKEVAKNNPKITPESEITLTEGKGCDTCRKTGFLGRVAISEFLEIDAKVRKLITQKTLATEIVLAAREKGMLTMMEEGFLKVLNGQTTSEEVLRVTRE